MNDKLAERLLAQIMSWDDIRLAKERLDLQALSSMKYDEYQQFYPGIRFIESLCLWLKQFPTIDERELAYSFMKSKLIFISNSEMNHLIRMAYPDVIEPYLIQQFARGQAGQFNEHYVTKIVTSNDFKVFRRKCLFLGLSDGARMDVFRRHSRLDHEQIYSIYSISQEKSKDFIKKLHEYLNQKGIKAELKQTKFKIAFLMDDFSGSGASFIRIEEGKPSGKIIRFVEHLEKIPEEDRPFDMNDFHICTVLYLATAKAKKQIESIGKEYFSKRNIDFSVKIIQELSDSIRLHENNMDSKFYEMVKKYYDNGIESESYRLGKISSPFLGFDEGGLSLVLNHNCPNNSLPILWFDPDRYRYRGLFPRVERFPSE